MKFIFPLFASCLLAIQTLYAQAPCGTPPPPAASFCQSACVYCELDGQTGNNSAGFGNQVGYCNGLVQNNAVWYAFIAGSTSISFSIETSNCTNGDGLQAAIWSACSDPEPIQCNIGAAGTGGATIDITYSSFTPGATYYLMIDGWIFDVCDYVIHVVDGSTFPQVPPAPDAPQGPSQVCNGGSIVYSIPPVENAGYYHWTAPVGSSINGLGNNVIIDQAEQGNEVTVTFSSAGGQVCVAVGNACVPQSNYACTAVSNAPYLLTQLPPLTLSFDQTPYTWPVDETVIYTAPGVYLASATLITDFGCDSIVRQLITIEQPVTSTVKGIVFWDDDQDGVLDPGEQPYRDGAVVTLSSGSFINSDANGGFEFSSTATIDTLRAVAPFPGINVRPLFRVKQAGQTDGYNFGLSPRPTGNDLSVHLNTSVVKPGELSVITVIAKNGGPSAVQQAMVQAKIPLDQLQLIQIEPASANVSINGNQLSWTIDVLNPDQQTDVRLLVEAPGSANLGNIYNMEASIGPTTSDRYLPNNFDARQFVVQADLTTADKLANPVITTPTLINSGQPLEYTIRFRNMGTTTLGVIKIVDTLDVEIDPSSFRLVVASHPCAWKIKGAGIVEFYFDPINLPTVAANEAASHGFIRFTVQTIRDLNYGDIIPNDCELIFDNHTPLVTNTATTQIGFVLPGGGLSFGDALMVSPNPAAFAVYCNWQTPAPADGRLRFIDLLGVVRVDVPVSAGVEAMHVDVQTVPSGLYHVVLQAGNLILSNTVIVVHAGIIGN